MLIYYNIMKIMSTGMIIFSIFYPRAYVQNIWKIQCEDSVPKIGLVFAKTDGSEIISRAVICRLRETA